MTAAAPPDTGDTGADADLRRPAAPPEAFALDPAIVHLTHGSFGACPRAALDAQAAWRARLEAATMRFFVVDWPDALAAARAAVAAFLRADPAGLVFVPNATTGVDTALEALVEPGADILTTDHGYAACRHALDRLAAARGARVVVAHLPFPTRDAHAHVDAIAAACTPATRVALLDHVTSPTALVLDALAVTRALAPRGVHVVVDAAHAPGQLDVDVAALAAAGVAAWTGNLHKWACAPKGAAALWVRDDLRARVAPLVTSHGFGAPAATRYHAAHDWTGTHDPTPYLTAPTAIDTIAALGGGWPAVRARGHRLACAMRDAVCDALGVVPPAPDAMIGMMAAIPVALPADLPPRALERRLLDAGWEVAIAAPAPHPVPGTPSVRVCAHLYNHLGQAEALARQLRALGVRGAPPPA